MGTTGSSKLHALSIQAHHLPRVIIAINLNNKSVQMPNPHRKKLTTALVSEVEDDDGEETFEVKFRNVLDEVHPVNCLY